MRVPPKKIEIVKEIVAVRDLLTLLYPRSRKVYPEFSKNGQHIVMFPGFGVDGKFFKPFNRFLERHSHLVYDWGLGLNDAGIKRNFDANCLPKSWAYDASDKPEKVNNKELGVPYLCARSCQKVAALYDIIEEPVTLIGWSLGGYIAREVARDLPDKVGQVITLGTPTVGGSKYTSTAQAFRSQGIDIDWIEQETIKRERVKIQPHVTAIYGKYDGVVHKSACIDESSNSVTHIEMNTSHMGLGFHFPLWMTVLKVLATASKK